MATNPFSNPDFGSDLLKEDSSANPFSDPNFDGSPPARGFKGWAQDAAATAVKGAISVPEAIVGLADIPTGGRVGKFLENKDGAFGFRPDEAKAIANNWHSDATKEAQRKFQEADGIWDKTKTAVQNPSLIATTVGESLPLMIAGGAIGRGLLAATKYGAMAANAGMLSASEAAALKAAQISAGAAGEGATMAGSAAEQIRQQTDDRLLSPTQAAAAAGTGVMGGVVSRLSGGLANKLGIGEADTMLTQGARSVVNDVASAKSIPRQVIEGAVTEGLLEELPQSVGEQILQNLALNKNWAEGLDDAVVMGALSGGLMGSGAAGLHGFMAKGGAPALTPEQSPAQHRQPAPEQPLQLGNSPDPLIQFRDGTVARQSEIDAHLASLPESERQTFVAQILGYAPQQADEPQLTTSPGATQFDGAATEQPSASVAAPDFDTSLGAQPEPQGGGLEFQRQIDTSGLSLERLDSPFAQSVPATALDRQALARQGAYPTSPTPAPVLDTRRLSEKLGLSSNRGGLEAAAAMAVDSGASPISQTANTNAFKQGGINGTQTQEAQQAVAGQSQGAGAQERVAAAPKIRAVKLKDGTTAHVNEADLTSGASQLRTFTADGKPRAARLQATHIAPAAPKVVLQNRNRATPASIAQMNAIAGKPDFLRTGASNTMDNGAPIVFGDLPQKVAIGRAQMVADGNGQRVPTQYAVVEAQDLITSNHADGSPVAEYANGVDGKLRAVAGNGRAAGLKAAWQRGTAGQYGQELVQDAPNLGIAPEVLAQFEAPVLVRVMDAADVTPDMGDRSNVQAGLQMSAVEQASNDAQRLNLRDMEFDELGNPTAQTVMRFMQGMPVQERGNMLDSQGRATSQLLDRIRAAAFKQAYMSDSLVELAAQSADPEAKNILNGLAIVAGDMAQLAGAGDFDIRQVVTDAANMAVTASRTGQSMAQYLQTRQIDENPETVVVMQFMAQNVRSAKRIADGLRAWAELAQSQIAIARQNAEQDTMFGDTPTLSRRELFERLNNDNLTEIEQQQLIEQQRRAELTKQGTQRPSAERAGNADGASDGAESRGTEPTNAQDAGREQADFALEQQTPEQIRAQEEAQAQAARDKAQADARAAEAERKAVERQDVTQRSEAAANDFQLGQSAEDNMSGQGDIFSSAPAQPESKPKNAKEALERVRAKKAAEKNTAAVAKNAVAEPVLSANEQAIKNTQDALTIQNTRSRLTAAYNKQLYRDNKKVEDFQTLRSELEELANSSQGERSRLAQEVLEAIDGAIGNLEMRKRWEAEQAQPKTATTTQKPTNVKEGFERVRAKKAAEEAERASKEFAPAPNGGQDAYAKAKADGKTKLNYNQWVQVRTPAFKAWFGDWEGDPANASKVVDSETGEPLVVYHGTDAEFTVFQPSSDGVYGPGAYMTKYGGDASTYGSNVMPVYASLQNPYTAAPGEARRAKKEGGTKAWSRAIQDKGHDGIVLQDMSVVVAFRPEQIKSAIGNSGAFDSKNPDIRYSRGTNEAMTNNDVVGNQGGRSADDTTPGGTHPFNGFTREQFLGNPKITSDANAKDLVPSTWKSLESEKNVPFAIGSGLTARYSELSAAVYNEKGDVVASYSFGDTLVVNKKYRRQGIGSELVYQWRMRNPNSKTAATRTKKSQLLQEKVWNRIRSERALYESRIHQDSNEFTAQNTADSRASTAAQNPSNPSQVWAAIEGVFEGIDGLRQRLDAGTTVVRNADELPQQFQQAAKDAQAQGFYDDKSKRIYLVADRIEAGQEKAVWLHEVFHKRGSELLGDTVMARLHGAVQRWGARKAGSVERQIYDAAHARAQADGNYNGEFLAYAIEEAVNRGVQPDLKANITSAGYWLGRVREAFANAMAKLTGAGVRTGTFRAEDLVAAAYGAAGLEVAGKGAAKSMRTEAINRLAEEARFAQEATPLQQFKETEQRIGGQDAYAKAKADGKTKLNYNQWVQVRTPAFKAWFGDWENDPANASKVVDSETGEPLVAYHGTDSDISLFDGNKTMDGSFWFTNDPKKLSDGEVGAAANGVVMPVYLQSKKLAGWDKYDRLTTDQLIQQGFDGVQLDDDFIIFNPTQIKSATGNNGNFDGANPDIRFGRSNIGQQGAQNGQENGMPRGLSATSTAQSRTLEDKINADLRRLGDAGDGLFRAASIPQNQLPDALSRALGALRAATGTQVHIFRNLTPQVLDFNGVSFRDGTVHINETSQNPATLTAAHEWLHNLRRTNPDLYRELADEVARQGRLPEYQQRLKRDGETRWKNMDVVEEELTAAAVSDALTDPVFLQRLAERDQSAFRRVAKAFLEFLKTLTAGWKDQGSNAYLQDVEAFRDKLEQVLDKLPVAKQKPGVIQALFLRLWHGSPHRDIEKTGFKLDKIGTGEGAQVYGWGMYFASMQEVAEWYRTALSGSDVDLYLQGKDGKRVSPNEVTSDERVLAALEDVQQSFDYDATVDPDLDSVLDSLHMDIKWNDLSIATRGKLTEEERATVDLEDAGLLATLDEIERVRAAFRYQRDANEGQLYGLDLPIEESDLLDWDKPLSEQSPKVREAITGILVRHYGGYPESVGNWSGKQIYQWLVSNGRGEKGASLALLKVGIPGLRYLDGNSRADGKGTHNYVIWDEALLTPEKAQIEAMYSRGQNQGASVVDDAALQRQFDETARAYGGQDAYAKAKADGKTKLNYGQWVQVRTPAFKAWFGDWEGDPANASKVVDSETGEPLVVYHGTRHSFDAFRKEGRRGRDRMHYFAADAAVASEYAGEVRYGTPNVMPAYLSVQRPYKFNAAGANWGSLPITLFPPEIARHFDERNILRGREGSIPQIGFTDVNRAAQDAGFDGVIAENIRDGAGPYGDKNPGDVFVTFRPEQIKSAIGNSGAFDSKNPDIRFSRASPTTGAGVWQSPEPTKFDQWTYLLQDKQIDTKRVLNAIKSTGQQVDDAQDVYLQETLYHGRTAKRVKDFAESEELPLMNLIRDNGLTMAQVEEYLHARHAPEANKALAERNPSAEVIAANLKAAQAAGDEGEAAKWRNAKPYTGTEEDRLALSGMSDAEAAAVMAALTPEQRTNLQAAAKMVDAIVAKTRQTFVEYGLETQETVDAWGKAWAHYVPLMREQPEDTGMAGMGTGQGFSVKGKETKGRTGSTKKVVDILANINMQRERAIVRGEKNRVAMALLGLVKANPNKDFWRVATAGEVPSSKVVDERTGLVRTQIDPLYKSRDNALVVKVDGQEQVILFNEDNARAMRMAAALKNMDAANLEGMLGNVASVTRYLAAINTQYNPIFGIVNMVRDFQEAAINLQATPLAGKQKQVLGQALTAVWQVGKELRAQREGKTTGSEWGKLWDDFQAHGGQTGYRDMFTNSADRSRALQALLQPDAWADTKWGKFFSANGTLKAPMEFVRRTALRPLLDLLSDYNEAIENGVRLSAYKTAIEQGMSRERAAELAKNLTVNFNRKGQVAQQVGALYAFFNASVQGTARVGQTLFNMEPGQPKTMRLSPLGKKIVGGAVLLGSVQALLLAAAGFGEDEPPEFIRERNLVIPNPLADKGYTTIPMPLGYHVLANLGRIPTEYALGGFKDGAKRAVSIVDVLADIYNPLGGGGLSMQTISPTVLDPFAALAENKDFTGRPIAKESFNKTTPGHALGRDTSSFLANGLAQSINYATGGTEYTRGELSPTPDQIDYLLGQALGGVGREASKVSQTAQALATGDDLPWHKVPLIGRFYGSADTPAAVQSAYYATMDDVRRHAAEVKGLRNDGRGQDAIAYMQKHPQAAMHIAANRAETTVKKLRDRISELKEQDAPREQVKALEMQMTEVMQQFSAAIANKKKSVAA